MKQTSAVLGDVIFDNNNVIGANTFINDTNNFTFDNIYIRNNSNVVLGTNVSIFSATNINMSANGILTLTNNTNFTTPSLIVTSGNASLNIPKTITTIPQITTLSILAGANLTQSSQTSVHNYSLMLNVVNASVLGMIDVSGKGFAGGAVNTNGSGTGKGIYLGSYGGGGGYGGSGGRGNNVNAIGGSSYGSLTSPTDIGSGGAGSDSYIGGAGGGAIFLNVSGTLNVSGSILAGGNPGQVSSPGAGSGGSVYIVVGILAGSGNISANGGIADTNNGAGGGGRIAVYYTSDSSTITKRAFGGATGYEKGGNGTQLYYGASSASGVVCSGVDSTQAVCTNGNQTVYTSYTINSTAGNSGNGLNVTRNITSSWNSSVVVWNDTSSNNSNIAIYNITGLNVSRSYDASNNGSFISGLTTSANGNLPLFNVTLASAMHKVQVATDTTPPGVTIVSPVNGSTYSSSSITFNVSLNEVGDTVLYSLDGGVTNFSMSSVDNLTYSATNTSISDGSYTFRVYVNDTSGNRNDTSFASFSIDTIPIGSITFVSPTPENGTFVSSNVTINISAVKNLSSCTLNNISVAGGSILGDGSDGSLSVSSANTIVNNYTYLTGNSSAGSTTLAVNSSTAFAVGDEVLIIQMQNASNGSAGNYEFAVVGSISGNNLSLTAGLNKSYFSGTFNSTNSTATQVVRVPQYTSVNVSSGASIISSAWNGWTGGIVVFRATGVVNITGSVNVTGQGFRGGICGGISPGADDGTCNNGIDGFSGESYSGTGFSAHTATNNFGGGSGGLGYGGTHGGTIQGGAGGSYGSLGTNGTGDSGVSTRGITYGNANLSILYLGSGGGVAGGYTGADHLGGKGGAGGGIVIVTANNIYVTGSINVSGRGGYLSNNNVGGNGASGGGGAGGSIFLATTDLTLGTNLSSAMGGITTQSAQCGSARCAGNGGNGRIALNFSILSGTTSPANANTSSSSILGGASAGVALDIHNNGANTWANYSLTGLASSNYFYWVNCSDATGNSNVSETRAMSVDTTNPLVSYSSETETSGGILMRAYVIVNATASDTNLKNLTINLYNSSGLVNSSVSLSSPAYVNFTNLNDGEYYFNVSAYDYAGNVNSTVTRNLTLDTLTPLIEFVSPTENSGVNKSQRFVLINVSASDGNFRNTTIYLYNSTGLVNSSVNTSSIAYVNFSVGVDGIYYYNATARDIANSANSTETRTIILDTTNPLVSYSSETETSGSILTRAYIIVNASASDTNLKNVTINLYNSSGLVSSSVNTSSPAYVNFSSLADGEYYFNVTVYDYAGNVNSTVTRNLTLDTLTPLIEFVSPTENSGVNKSQRFVLINVSASDGNFRNTTIYLYNSTGLVNSSVNTSSIAYVNFSVGVDGIYYYNATARDIANSANSTETRTIILDTVNPGVEFGTGTESSGAVYTRTNIIVNASASDTNLKNVTINLYNSSGLVNSSSSLTSPDYVNFSSLADGVYYFNVTAYDYAGNVNSTATRNLTVDTGAPTLVSTSKTRTLRYENVNLSVNASDSLSGLQAAIASVLYPNGTVQNYSMSLLNGIFNLSIVNMSVVGDYDINYTINDSAGNILETTDYFEVYVPLPFNVVGNVTDALGNLKQETYTFFRPDTNITLYNFTGSSYDLSDSEIANRTYDLEVIVGSNVILWNNISLTSAVIPVNIDNLTAPASGAITNNKFITGLGVNTSFEGTATMNLSYAGLFDADTSAVNETSITAYKCSNWSYTSRICNGEFTAYTNITIDTINDVVIVYTNGFSSYFLTAGTCGNSICQAAYGETTSTCSLDCSSPAVAVADSGGGGGGGGGATTSTIASKLFEVSMVKIEREINVGEAVSEQLSITNSKSSKIEVSVSIDDSLKEIIEVDSKVEVLSLDSSVLSIKINGVKEGAYVGNIYLKSGTYNQTIPVSIIVKGKTSKLLDVKVYLDKKQVMPGDEIKFTVAAFNLGQLSRYDILLGYDLIYEYTNSSIIHNEESRAIETSLTITEGIVIPADAPYGKYILRVKASYDNSSAVSSAQLVVGSVNIFMSPIIKDYLPVIVSVLVSIFILISGGYYFVSIRRKLFEKKMEEKKKSSIYPFPDFFALPKSKYAYIGMVADADERTYLDHTQLNRHTLIAGGTGSGKTVAGMVVVEELLKKGLPVVVFDPVGQWTGFANKNTDSTMKALYKKFKISGAKEFKPTIIEINEKTMSLDIIHYMHKSGLTVLKLDDLTPKQADIFIERCLNSIYRAKLSETGALKSLVVLDEVHRLLPKYGGRRAYLKLEQAVREFRKWGVGLLMISQVLTDFKGSIRGNIGTEIQLHTKYEGDIKRVRERHGSILSKLISRLPVGLGMIESGGYNKGLPYFVEFRPLMHSPYKLNEKEISKLIRKDAVVLSKKEEPEKEKDSLGESGRKNGRRK